MSSRDPYSDPINRGGKKKLRNEEEEEEEEETKEEEEEEEERKIQNRRYISKDVSHRPRQDSQRTAQKQG